jgi:hypothetical protein
MALCGLFQVTMTATDEIDEYLLPGLPVELIRACYTAAPGREISSAKFASPKSSAALVANAFGIFLDRPRELPGFAQTEHLGWPAVSVQLEAHVRFPWAAGHHRCLDVLIETGLSIIGIESKRYEPYRKKSRALWSDAYWRPVWGPDMAGYEDARDRLRDEPGCFHHLDADQLVKHAFGLRTLAHKRGEEPQKRPVLMYLFAEPGAWPDGRVVPPAHFERHRAEIEQFTRGG